MDYAIDTPTDRREGAPEMMMRGRPAESGAAWPLDGRLTVAAPGMLDYLRIVYRHRWLALGAFFLVALPVGLWGFVQQPAYEARVRLVLDPEPSVPVSFQDAAGQRTMGQDTRTQEEVLRSRETLHRAVLALRMWERKDFATLTAPSPLSRVKGWLHLGSDAAVPAATKQTDAEKAEAVVPLMATRIAVNAIPLSRLVDVIVEAPDPKLAADFANEVAKQFIKQDVEVRVVTSRQSSAWLEARLEEQRKKVEADDAALQQYKEQQNAISVEDRQNIVVQRLSDLNAAVTKARTDRLAKEGVYRQVEQAQTNPALLDTIPAIAASSAIQQIRSQVGEQQRQQLELSQKYGERHPEMLRIKASIENTQQRLNAEVAKAADVIKNEFLAAQSQEQGLTRALDMQKEDALRLNKQGLEYGRLVRDAQSSRQIYDALQQQARQVDITGEYKQSSVRVIDQARAPFAPTRPQRVKFAALAFATGLFAALGLALGWEFMDPRIKTPAQIQEYLQLPFIGLVPSTKLAAGEERPVFAHGGPPSPFADALRRVRANLRLSAPGPGPHVLLVTSSAPREGKTTVCVGLAHCFSIANQRVLLLDCDLRRPSVHRTLHVKSRRGMSEYLAGKAELNDVIQPTTYENLSVIPCGSVPENPSELLGLPRMQALLEAVRDRYDWILIDTAPVLSAPDAAQIARMASGILFVVGAEMTSRDEVQRAEQELMRARVPFAGSVLNRAQVERHGYYYAPYYNKAYESYYSQPNS